MQEKHSRNSPSSDFFPVPDVIPIRVPFCVLFVLWDKRSLTHASRYMLGNPKSGSGITLCAGVRVKRPLVWVKEIYFRSPTACGRQAGEESKQLSTAFFLSSILALISCAAPGIRVSFVSENWTFEQLTAELYRALAIAA